MELLRRAFAQLHDRYRSMTPGSRLMAAMLAAAVVVGAGYVAVQQNARPEVDLLRVPVANSRLQLMEAAFGKAKLKDYAVRPSSIRGSSIFVPRGQESKYMEALKSANALPRGLGDIQNQALDGSIFDIGSSREQLRNRIAKQQAVAEAIRSRPGIEDASVIYDENKTNVFEPKVATAVAYVWPVGSNQLDEATVLDIRNDVVGAYSGLKPESVTVSDLNGHTWRGSIGSADEIRYHSRKRDYEQDLRTKILGILGHVPNITVELNAELDRTALTPTSARVSISVPSSYLTTAWRQRNPIEPGHADKTLDPAALDQTRIEESANIQRCVATLLPQVNGVASPANVVTVTAYQEMPAATTTAIPAWGLEAWNWAVPRWKILAGVGFALVILLALRLMVRSRTSEVEESVVSTFSTPPSEKPATKTATLPPPHWRHHAGAADRSLRDELSELVEADPETAASILRNWIGQTS